MNLKTMNPARKRVQISFKDSVSKTKPEFSRSTDINNIVKSILPAPTPMTYGDISNIPDLITAFATVKNASNLFNQLPSNVRKLIDNDPSKLGQFLSDPANQDFLIKEGVLTAPQQKLEASPKEKPEQPSVEPSETPEPKAKK